MHSKVSTMDQGRRSKKNTTNSTTNLSQARITVRSIDHTRQSKRAKTQVSRRYPEAEPRNRYPEPVTKEHDGRSKEKDITTSTMQQQSQEKAKPTRQTSPQSHGGAAGVVVAEDSYSDGDDLYRAEEEIEQERLEKDKLYSAIPTSLPAGECSVEEPVDLLTYCKREWRGNTTKSDLIKTGYFKISETYDQLRRVRGDNYCALRATLFQLLSQSNELPDWLKKHDVTKWPREVLSKKDLNLQWRFPFESRDRDAGGAMEQISHYLGHLKEKWQEAVRCNGAEERERLCQQVFQGQEEEYGLLEALKFLMLRTAVQLHTDMAEGTHVPEFCWLLFARDSSRCPSTLFTNHLRHVGFTGGLEQVEMFLLGYSLRITIKVYRLYKADTEEFITYYPTDQKDTWPYICLITEDDRHYNVPALSVPKETKPASSKFDESGAPRWNRPKQSTTL
ncbi:ubiquitin thioesterase otulin [Chanos chanos]|uniref:Ubiquitin thioesterase otulin n=1 Tax=Chanos chanos TaxID=29144 RepID=A0A6J2VAQ0_CHACN|nr:ubiquitin thioesterase otulin-like [Chanos chanos]